MAGIAGDKRDQPYSPPVFALPNISQNLHMFLWVARNIMKIPIRIFWLGIAMVAASTAAFPWVTGYGTILYQVIVLGAWSIVAAVTSQPYADLHHGPVWSVALLLNVCLFAFPALMVFFVCRRRWPRLSVLGILGWTVFYLMCLFALFPAIDGP